MKNNNIKEWISLRAHRMVFSHDLITAKPMNYSATNSITEFWGSQYDCVIFRQNDIVVRMRVGATI